MDRGQCVQFPSPRVPKLLRLPHYPGAHPRSGAAKMQSNAVRCLCVRVSVPIRDVQAAVSSSICKMHAHRTSVKFLSRCCMCHAFTLTLQLQLVRWEKEEQEELEGPTPLADSVSPKPFPFFGFLLAIPTPKSSTGREKKGSCT